LKYKKLSCVEGVSLLKLIVEFNPLSMSIRVVWFACGLSPKSEEAPNQQPVPCRCSKCTCEIQQLSLTADTGSVVVPAIPHGTH